MGRSKPVSLSSKQFPTRGLAAEYIRGMLRKYRPGDRVSDADAKDVESLLDRHPDREDKVGCGVDHFEVQEADFGSKCFRVVRIDGSWARFSYKKCISPESAED